MRKKIKRLYLDNTAFTCALNPGVDLPALLEQFYVNFLGATFFFPSPREEEIDIIPVADDKILPVEVKIREKLQKKDLKPIFQFMKKYDIRRGLIVTKYDESFYEENGSKLMAIPYWKFRTVIDYLEEF